MNLNDLVRKCIDWTPAIRRVSMFDNIQIMHIERTSEIDQWTDKDFKLETATGDAGFLVANESMMWNAPLVGFILFHLNESEASIRRMNVLKEFRREKVGTHLLRRAEEAIRIASSVKQDFGEDCIGSITCDVPETCVEMQCFLRKHGYKIRKTIKATGSDVYQFEKSLR